MEMKDFAIETEILYDVQYFLMDWPFKFDSQFQQGKHTRHLELKSLE